MARSRAAALCAGLALLVGTAAASLGFAAPETADEWVIWSLIVGAGLAGSAAAVAFHGRASAACWLAAAAAATAAAPLVRAAGSVPAAKALAVLGISVLFPPALLRAVEEPVSRRLARLADAGAVGTGLACAATSAWGGDSARIAATLASFVAVGAGLTALFESGSQDDRRRVLWLVFGAAVSTLGGMLYFAAFGSAAIGHRTEMVVSGLLCLILPAALTVALVAPHAVDVRSVIRSASVLLVMLTLSAAVYEGVASVWEMAAGERPAKGVPALLAAAIAAGYQRVRLRVEASMDEMLFGRSADAVETLTRLGTDLTAGAPPPLWLHTLRTTLGVPGIALRQDGETIATAGTVDTRHTAVTPLRAGQDEVGDLVVGLPPGHLRLPPGAAAVVGLVAAPLAQALHAARLGEQLRVSRGLVVTALEEERRRMRRDLHDGLGPTLTGIAYSADAAANLVRTDPDRAVETLRGLRGDVGDAIAEIRRIVYGLRPRALDELGLVDAIRQRIAPLRAADGRPLAVVIDAPAVLPPLPAAVEVAAYRVAVEAVTNIARHAAVAAATLTLDLPGGAALRVAVADRGPSTGPWRHGVGIRSMHERAERIGGTLTIETSPDGATVTAVLPLAIPA
ncbi:sensor histidine kinase [Yinghuangia soli]|uniref:Histidine kinase n=1 Tax=Yinghuangia soli TaxID=2908204 RepID=A0AA41Q5F7_9ACTN|nr:histidine kinase [Yinghuangia soli]MCF2531641.1 histidine kinase [Yinghuangia soli]